MNPRVFLDFTVDNAPLGRVIFELFADYVPKTCENFRALCTGEKGLSPASQLPLYFKGSIIHRSIQDFMIQGGDFTKRSGTGGESIYGAPFEDEDLSRPVDSEGLLVMANRGPNTNGSQFFVTLRPCPHLDGKHVVFGRVVRGYDDVIRKISAVPTDSKDRPERPVVISSCGELELKKRPVSGKRASPPASENSESESDSARRHKKRKKSHRHRRAGPGDDEDVPSRSDRTRKEEKPTARGKDGGSAADTTNEPHKETEEEYDARLEREENERLMLERKTSLAQMRERMEKEAPDRSKSGVKYKGRGSMKYIDPETSSRR